MTEKFIEAYINASTSVCEERDVKGLYAAWQEMGTTASLQELMTL